MTVLLREAVGERLRRARTTQSRTLREVSRAARVSLGYLSEVERGRKEASSELLSSICEALEITLPDLLVTVATDISIGDGILNSDLSEDRLVQDGALVENGGVAEEVPAGADDGRLVPSGLGERGDIRLQSVMGQSKSRDKGVVAAA